MATATLPIDDPATPNDGGYIERDMEDDPNIGRVITESELFGSYEFYEPTGTGMRIFPIFSRDGGIYLNPSIGVRVGKKIRTYEVEREGAIGLGMTVKILRRIGRNHDGV
jgi:hypothetical protein